MTTEVVLLALQACPTFYKEEVPSPPWGLCMRELS